MESINIEEYQSSVNAIIAEIDNGTFTKEEKIKQNENKNILSLDENVARFKDSDWFEELKKTRITVAGCGGIGSWAAFLIARLNPRYLSIYDPDKVDETNLAGQLFSIDDISWEKTNVIANKIRNYSDYHSISGFNRKHYFNGIVDDVTVCGFDNMESRIKTFEKWCYIMKESADVKLFIDARLSAEEFQVYCFQSNNEYAKKKYREEYLFTSAEAEETVCSYKQTTFCAAMVASIITNLIANYCANKACGEFRVMPFKTIYDATTMQLKTES